MVAALEEGRRSAGSGLKTWDDITTWSSADQDPSTDGKIDLTTQLTNLSEYLTLSILDPASLHDDIHPAPVTVAPLLPSPNRSGARGANLRTASAAGIPSQTFPSTEDENLAEERWARYRVGGLIGLAWLLQQLDRTSMTVLPSGLRELLNDPVLWTALSPLSSPKEGEALGMGGSQPPVRRAAYSLLGVLIETHPAEVGKEELLDLLAVVVLGNCWLEQEAIVWETAGPVVVGFLSSGCPSSSMWPILTPCDCQSTAMLGKSQSILRRVRDRNRLSIIIVLRTRMVRRTKSRTERVLQKDTQARLNVWIIHQVSGCRAKHSAARQH